MPEIDKEILALKREKDAVILAHYYVEDEVQALADYVGDSYYLSRVANTCPQKTIVFCGVRFMGESAKIMNPEKTVLMPDAVADCPMAHMAEPARIQKVRKQYPEAAVVCYINSTAEVKAVSDVCVTSSNAVKIVAALPNKQIYFVPDENLGRFVAKQLPEKEFIFHPGYCPIHAALCKEDVEQAKAKHPNAPVLAHPECREEVLQKADYVGSTSGIIEFATKSGTGCVVRIETEKSVKALFCSQRESNLRGYEAHYAGKDKTMFNRDGAEGGNGAGTVPGCIVCSGKNA